MNIKDFFQNSKWKTFLIWFTGFSYIAAGIPHFSNAEFYMPMMPPYLPWHLELIYLSGLFEILGGIGVIIPATRKFSGWGLIALLIAVFPANIHIVLNEVQLTAEPINPVLMWARLPFQAFFIGWIYFVTQKMELKQSSET